MVSIQEFQKLDLRVGEIISVEHVPNADRLYVLNADVGGRQVQLLAGIRQSYTPEELKGKRIVVIANLDPATIRGLKSEGMLLAAENGGKISLVTLDKDIPVGSKVL
jgi:methionine--tRNA ligase beta chain